MIIGGISILGELIILRAAVRFVPEMPARIISVFCSIIIAFFLNVNFNFHIPKAKRNKAFLLFLSIALFSFLLNIIFVAQIKTIISSWESARIVSSGTLFSIAYLLHRRYSFRAFKQVGVAVYADGHEDIRGIWQKISQVGDFIHIDIIDRTFNTRAPDPAVYRLETIRAYWPLKEIHCHVMSRTPGMWIDRIADFADTIIVHLEIDENPEDVYRKIKDLGKKAGFCLTIHTPVKKIADIISRGITPDEIMLLTIDTPGESGQIFNKENYLRIREVDRLDKRDHFAVCVDGGVNSANAGLLNVEKVVSGSFVLKSSDPMHSIIKLQTSGQYGI